MYQIKCDGYILFDPRDDDLIVLNPMCNLEVNTVGEASFTIYDNHPYFDKLKKLKSVFEVLDDIGVIFRGRMTDGSSDFYNGKDVDLEGAMAFFNDSTVRPFSFPEDFLEDADYITAAESGNVIEFFLNWLINQHNDQVQEFQQFKLGNVTVTDPNNYLSRADSTYPKTWEVLKSKLFGSALGGYLCIRYEDDGNYIDYLADFELTNTQEIVFGENLLDLKRVEDCTETYSAVIPIGATTETTDEAGNTVKTVLTIESLPDGDITDDIVKNGDTLYSKAAVEAYGWICAPVKESTWEDVTEAENLQTKGVNALSGDFTLQSDTVEVSAVDQHFTAEQVQSFRIYRKVKVRSSPHGMNGTFHLSKLSLDLLNPDNTKITVGATQRTLTDITSQRESSTVERVETVRKDIEANRTEVDIIKSQVLTQSTEVINTCNQIILSALEAYVETSNFEEFKKAVSAQLEVLSSEIIMSFTSATESINNVNGDLQAKFNELYKHISFSLDGITIGGGENAITMNLDNDQLVFSKAGVEIVRLDINNFTPTNVYIKPGGRLRLGNFAFDIPESGGVIFGKVGG